MTVALSEIADRKQSSHHPVVYYIKWPALRIVKIGTTRNMFRRAFELNKVTPGGVLVGVTAGGYTMERVRHEQWAHLRCAANEHFHLTPELEEHMADADPLTEFTETDGFYYGLTGEIEAGQA